MRMCTIIIIFAYKYLHYEDNTVNYIFFIGYVRRDNTCTYNTCDMP